MSLQSDLELCLGYAERLQTLQERRVQGQNNIVHLHGESERLKNKNSKCLWVCVLSVGIPGFFTAFTDLDTRVGLMFLLIGIVICAVSAVICLKTRRERGAYEARKPELLRQYTAEVETCERELSELIDEIYDEDLTDIVPEEFFYVSAIEFCLSQVHKKLANTATEVFRQLDAEIKRQENMELMQQMNDARLEQMNEIRRAIDVNTMVNVAGQIGRDS